MRKFDVPLKIVEGSTDPNKLIKAKKIMEVLTEEELGHEIPEDRANRVKSMASLESLIEELMEDDAEGRLNGLELKVTETPKNYDAALSLSIRGKFEDAHNLMKELIEEGDTKNPMNL